MRGKRGYVLISVAIVTFLASCAPVAATTLYDATVFVDALSYKGFYCQVTEGTTLTILIQVTSGTGITLYIFDETNFNKYNSSQSFTYSGFWPDYVSATVTWQASSTQTYYFILDNMDSFVSQTVHLKITYGEAGLPGIFDLFLSLLPIIAIACTIGAVVVFAVALAVKKRRG